MRSVLSSRTRVIPAARLNFVVSVFRLDINSAERSIANGVRRRVSNVVLAAELLRNLIKRLPKLLDLIADFDHAATSVLSELLHIGNSGIAAKTVGKAAISNEQNVADR